MLQFGPNSWIQLFPVVTTTFPLGVIAGELHTPPPGGPPPTAEKLKLVSRDPLARFIANTFPTVIGASGRLAETPTYARL